MRVRAAMKKYAAVLSAILACSIAQLSAQEPPAENRYDVLGKVFRPFWSVLLAESTGGDRAVAMRIKMKDVTGRLPKDFAGATLEAAVQFPDKLRLSAPVLGEVIVVCRNGDEVWATPGEKVEFLLKQFKPHLPKPTKKPSTPLFLPVTAKQAVFLPALFVIEDGKTFEELNGETCRLIEGALMPELAKLTKAEDFRAALWIAAGHVPRQIEVTRRDFTALVAIESLRFAPSLPAATWQPPEGATDVFRTTPEALEQVLFVVMNSLDAKEATP
jgi:hypothetical protein